MIIYLFGPDSYRRIRSKERYLAATREKYPHADVAEFDFEADDELAFLRFASAAPLFSPIRIAVVRNVALLSREGREAIKQASESPITNLIVEEEKSLPTAEFSFLKKKASIVEEYAILEGETWQSFALTEATRLGLSSSDPRLQLLITMYEGDSWGFATEAARLALWEKAHSSVQLPTADISRFAFGSRGERLLHMTIAVASGEAPARFFYATAAMTAKNHTPLWAGYDLAVKTGKLDYEEALLDFALS